MNDNNKTIQDREPNFRTDAGQLFLVRCFSCDPQNGRENFASAVAGGVCEWCGWSEASLEACTYEDYTKCKDFRQELPWFDACKHGNSRQFCTACKYVPLNDPFGSANQEISELRTENKRLEEENKLLRGACVKSSDDIDKYLDAAKRAEHLERIIQGLLNR